MVILRLVSIDIDIQAFGLGIIGGFYFQGNDAALALDDEVYLGVPAG